MNRKTLSTLKTITTEQISKYHPDKYADQISDAIVTECLRQDKDSQMNADDFAEYVGIYTSIKEKETRIAEWFERKDEPTALNEALKAEGTEKK